MRHFFLALAALASLSLSAADPAPGSQPSVPPSAPPPMELALTPDQLKALKPEEAHYLARADEVFNAKQYRVAESAYRNFLSAYWESQGVPYALIRRGRCLHLCHKHSSALANYDEAIDKFRAEPAYAVGALYYAGLLCSESGNLDRAAAYWARVSENAEYSKQPLAAAVMLLMGGELDRGGDSVKARECFEQIAVNFRASNPAASGTATEKAAGYYLRALNSSGLFSFYVRLNGGQGNPLAAGAPQDEPRFLNFVRTAVRKHDAFKPEQAAQRDAYYRYWAAFLDGKPLDSDDFQIDLAEFKKVYEKDEKAWIQRMDQQFGRAERPDAPARVLRWITLYKDNPQKVGEYYNKLDVARFSAVQLVDLLRIAYENVGNADFGRAIFARIRLPDLSDNDKKELARFFAKKDSALALDLCNGMRNKELGLFALLEHYSESGDAEHGLPLAQQLSRSAVYGGEALFRKGTLHFQAKDYEAALRAFKQAEMPPESLWKISECHLALGKPEQAIAQLRDIESLYPEQRAAASYKIAAVYKDRGQRASYIAALKKLLQKYPGTEQAEKAIQELQALGANVTIDE